MIRLVVRAHGRHDTALVFDLTTLNIGRYLSNHLVLDDLRVARRSNQILVRHGKYGVVDCRGPSGTYLNGDRIEGARMLTPGDRLRVGPFEIEIGPFVDPIYEPRDAMEARFLAALESEDDRRVYADWLDEQGLADRAEYLRAAIAHKRVPIAREIVRPWRARVSDGPIERCDRGATCPGRWSSLPRDATEIERTCNTCGQLVLFAATHAEARERVCVIDPVSLDDDPPIEVKA